MNTVEVNLWFSEERQNEIVERLTASQNVGLTRQRAVYFVRLCVYLSVRQRLTSQPSARPPLDRLMIPTDYFSFSHRDAHDLFYSGQERGSERAAGMMMKALRDLGFIKYPFDGNVSRVLVNPLPELFADVFTNSGTTLIADDFDPRGDAIPISALLAANYNWMNHNTKSIPYRISELLRQWAEEYSKGMRVLRRVDNQNPVGFYLLYPVITDCDVVFTGSPSEGFHLGSLNDVDPFKLAIAGDETCKALFVRSWVIEESYRQDYLVPFLKDVQSTLEKMQKDFPNLCDLWTLIIHPYYGKLATSVGFQQVGQDKANRLYWMYQALDRFLALDMDVVGEGYVEL